MATHPTKSKIESLRRPSGGLCGTLNGVEIDWEPGDPPIEMNSDLREYWIAIQRHTEKKS